MLLALHMSSIAAWYKLRMYELDGRRCEEQMSVLADSIFCR